MPLVSIKGTLREQMFPIFMFIAMIPSATRSVIHSGLTAVLCCLLLSQSADAQETSAASTSKTSCAQFFQGDSLKSFLDRYSRLSSIKPLWDTYRAEQEAIVITHTPEFAQCAVVLYKGKRLADLELSAPITMANGNFEFILAGKSLFARTDIPTELKKTFDNNGIKHALIATTSLPPIVDGGVFNLIVHEGFHIKQIAAQLGLAPDPSFTWPRWDKQPQRLEIPRRCYLDFTVRALHTKERETLASAMKLLLLDKKRPEAIAAAKDFIKIRNNRYAKLKDVRVPSQTSANGITCDEAEAILELEEGMAEYLGAGTMFALNLVDANFILSLMSRVQEDWWYYRTGMGQLILLRELQGTVEISKTTNRIAKSESWEKGIFYEFTQDIQKR